MHHLDAFSPVWMGAGTRGFFNEPYWYHHLVPGLTFKRATFVAKTATTYPTKGHLPLDRNFGPKEWFPRCIAVYPFRRMALNAVGLSGPGLKAMLRAQRWQKIREPFFLSYMPVLPEEGASNEFETNLFVRRLRDELSRFQARVGIQLNVSCPNAGADSRTAVLRAYDLLSAFKELNVPLVIKIGLLTSPEEAVMIAKHPACSGICISNTVPFGEVLPHDWWEQNFPKGSPLAHRGLPSGGLSGAPLLPYVIDWIRRFRGRDPDTHLNAGGGIMRARDVDRLYGAGASSISIATIAMVRPWKVRGVISRAHELFDNTP